MSQVIENKYDFVVLFDVENGNPNGDPDSGNMPRTDIETGHGLVTNNCLKRKIRDYVELVKDGVPGFEIYVKGGVPLETNDKKILGYLGVPEELWGEKKLKEGRKLDPLLDVHVRDAMCTNFFDIRTFGAVMTTFVKGGLNCGQVRGPVQITDAKSVDPVISQELTITRRTHTTVKDAAEKGSENTIGRKYIVPYGLYRAEGFISANLARKTTGFTEEDLELLWDAIVNMFEHDRSAARGKMCVRELIIFKHDSELGNAPAHKLFDLVKVSRKDGVVSPRAYSDYVVNVDEAKMPEGVCCIRRN